MEPALHFFHHRLRATLLMVRESLYAEFDSNFSSRLTASMSAAPMPYSSLKARPMLSILSRREFMVHVRLHSFCSRVFPVSRSIVSMSARLRSEEHTSELQSPCKIVC